MRSMTGFGMGESPLGAGKLALEIRGVNHRFLDVRVRMPRELGELSPLVEQMTRERMSRGRYEIAVRIEGVALGSTVLDRDRARSAYRALCELRDELAPHTDVPFALLASIPDLFVPSSDRESDAIKNALYQAFESASRAIDTMRRQEGGALQDDLRKRLTHVLTLIKQIETEAPTILELHRNRLLERAERLRTATDLDIDPHRLEQEIALFADRVDISEELTRLTIHCDQFIALLGTNDAVGRRLDFLLQEMAREANTVGAKSPDAHISHRVVEMKAEIERMREQVQNIE